MGDEALVNGYLEGSLSRRAFVRGLIAAGMTVGAAVSYAHLLGAERAMAGAPRGLSDYHGEAPPLEVVTDPVRFAPGSTVPLLRGRIRGDATTGHYGYRFRVGPVGSSYSIITGLDFVPNQTDPASVELSLGPQYGELLGGVRYFSQLASNGVFGEKVEFILPGGLFEAQALPPALSSDRDGNAILRGSINTAGRDTSYFFRISDSSEPFRWQSQAPGAGRSEIAGALDGPVKVAEKVTGLERGRDYYVTLSASAGPGAWDLSEPVRFRIGEPADPEPDDGIGPVAVLGLRQRKLARIRKKRKLDLSVELDEPGKVELSAFVVQRGRRRPLASGMARLDRGFVPTRKSLSIPRNKRKLLKGKAKTIEIVARATDGFGSRATTSRRFRVG